MSAASGRPTSYAELADVIGALPLLCREARRARGLSLRTAAEQMGLSFATISRFEAGKGAELKTALTVIRWLDGREAQ